MPRNFSAYPHCGFSPLDCNPADIAGQGDILDDVTYNEAATSINHYLENGICVLNEQRQVVYDLTVAGPVHYPVLGQTRNVPTVQAGYPYSIAPPITYFEGLNKYFLRVEMLWNSGAVLNIKGTLRTQDTATLGSDFNVILDAWFPGYPPTYTPITATTQHPPVGVTVPNFRSSQVVVLEKTGDIGLITPGLVRLGTFLLEFNKTPPSDHTLTAQYTAVAALAGITGQYEVDRTMPVTGEVVNCEGLLSVQLIFYKG